MDNLEQQVAQLREQIASLERGLETQLGLNQALVVALDAFAATHPRYEDLQLVLAAYTELALKKTPPGSREEQAIRGVLEHLSQIHAVNPGAPASALRKTLGLPPL